MQRQRLVQSLFQKSCLGWKGEASKHQSPFWLVWVLTGTFWAGSWRTH